MSITITITVLEPPTVGGYSLHGFKVGNAGEYVAFAVAQIEEAVEKWVSLGTAEARLYAVYEAEGDRWLYREWTGYAWASRRAKA